jgi:cytochrome c-type biogenesis protein CcsB
MNMRSVVRACVIACMWACVASGQTAPAGNAHPQMQALSEPTEGATNPFGEPVIPSTWTADRKRALASGVDLGPLRSLAVFHDGRVKILDTLGRETVRRITGRKDYVEPGEGASSAVHFDPLFTFLDLAIDPWYYADKPLIGVEYLPLRRKLVEAAYPGDTASQERWLKLGRVSPVILARYGDGLQEKYAFEPSYAAAFERASLSLRLVDQGWRNLLMVAPASSAEPYRHLSSLPADSAARSAALRLGAAWRAGDAAGVNEAVGVLVRELPRINASSYPTFKRGLEAAYNRVNAFEWGYWVYLGAFVSLVLAFGTGRGWLIRLGVIALVGAVLLHGFGFVARCLIAERFAIQNQFESMTGVSLFANVVGLAIMLGKRQWLYGAAAAGVGFMVLVTATQTGIPGGSIEREAAILNTSVLLKYHVTTVLTSYGLISLGFVISLFYLGTYYAARLKGGAAPALAAAALNVGEDEPRGAARTLSDLDKAQMTVLQLAFWALGVGLLLGAWWADHSWGRWWAFDPKETWALATWIIYLIVVHVRLTAGHNRGLVTAWLSVLGFVVMLWTYFGVNLLLPGLHAYA